MSRTTVISPNPRRLQAVITSANGRYPCWISDDGLILYSGHSPILHQSHDDGQTWEEICRFTQVISAVRTTGDGELLVCLSDPTDAEPGSIWKSGGYDASNAQAASWFKVLSLSPGHVYVANAWGIYRWRHVIVAAEYGSKMTDVNARRAYLSIDHGSTWRTIFDLGGRQETHCHGVCYDPYAQRIWLSNGDYPYGGIHYSDDWGTTWKTVDTEGVYLQPTSMIALENCVLFGSDTKVNGVLRIRRTNRGQKPRIEIAHRIEDDSCLKVVGHLIYRRPTKGATIYIPYGSAVEDGVGVIVATKDGEHFYEIFRDTEPCGVSRGFQACFETARGTVIAPLRDQRQESWSKLVAQAQQWK